MSAFGKKLSVSLAIGVVAIIFLVGGLFWTGGRIAGYGDEAENWRRTLSDRLVLSQSFAALRSQYDNQAKDYLVFMKRAIPAEDGLIDFSKSLQFLASQEGTEMGFQFTGDPVPAGSDALGFIPFNLSLKGGFAQITSFVEQLDRFRFLVAVENLDLSLDGKVYAGTLNGRVFFR